MKKLTLGLVLSLASLLPISSASAIPLTNLGFETPVVGAVGYTYNPVTADWVYAGNSGLTGNGTGFTFGNPVAPEGVQVAFLQSGTGYASGSISQVFSTAVNASMGFTFSAAQRGNYGGIQGINVLLDSVVIGSLTPIGFSYLDYTTTLVSVLAGSHTLTFVGMNLSGDNTAFIDNLRVTSISNVVPVSLPSTIALLLAGFGLLAYRSRRSVLGFGV